MNSLVVLGAGGMLGQDLMEVLAPHNPRGLTRNDIDITSPHQVGEAIHGVDIVINAAAYTHVDAAESDEDTAFQVNAVGAEIVADACRKVGARLIHVSTDYVFGGEATVPYPEDHPRNPQSAYGRTKAAGEERVLSAHPDKSIIIRTAWLYGEHGPNFVSTILSLAASRDSVSVVTDQVGQPTWSKDLARMIANLAYSSVRSGVFHGTNSGQASWWEFARAIYTHAGLDPERVLPTNSAEFVRPAPRPAWSVLGHHEWSTHNLPEPRSWQEAFDEAWSEVFSQRAKN